MFQRQLNVSASPRYRDASLSLSKIYIYILLLTKSNALGAAVLDIIPFPTIGPKPTDQRVSSVESPGQRSVQSPHPPLRTPASRLFTDIVIKCSMKSRVPRHNILRERADAQGARTIATLLRYDENNVQGHFHFLFFLPLPVLDSRKNPRRIIVSRSGIIRRRRRVKKLSRRCPRRKCLV